MNSKLTNIIILNSLKVFCRNRHILFSTLRILFLPIIKGNGDHSEVRDKFCSNYANEVIKNRKLQKKYGVPIHIRKLGGATY